MKNNDFLKYCRDNNIHLQTDVSLHTLTSFHIGGLASYFYVAKNIVDIHTCVQAAQLCGIPLCVIGGGSNMLVSDSGFDGLMMRVDCADIEISNTLVTVGAGCVTASVAASTASAGLSGFEWAAGIPGRIGGAIYGNAGAMNGEMKDVIVSVTCMNASTGEIRVIKNIDCAFNYRDSIFKKTHEIILSCTMKLTRGDTSTSQQEIRRVLSYRNNTQPKKYGSSGCMFKNYVPQDAEIERLRKHNIPETMLSARRISAGYLIDQSSLKGMRVGGAVVSEIHGNFIVNSGNATANDVYTLAQKIKESVQSKFEIVLHEEVQYIGFEKSPP